MIRTILKRELANYLKNPIFYIGAVFILISVYGSVSPYLKIHYFTKESEIRTLEGATEISDSDIMDGYVPTTKEEQYQMGSNIIYDTMTKNLGMGQKDADAVVNG
jgi:ABC-2 type transport system permease protein